MDFTFTAEQELLRDSLTRFLATRYDLDKSRAAAKSGAGWQPEIWRGFAQELGILGVSLPEHAGGLEGGAVELMVLAEALGNALVVEPFVDTVVVAGGLLRRAAGAAADELMARIAEGAAVVAVAALESASAGDPCEISTTAELDGEEWVLRGSKIVVMNAPLATHLLISARSSDGVLLFLTESDWPTTYPGMVKHGYRTIDDRSAADIVFEGLRLPASALLDGPAGSESSLAQAWDEGAAAICAEAVGCMRKVLADTVDYCKQRQQFGQPIGAFQVLQHRMVNMHMEVEQAVAATYLAVLNLDSDARTRAEAVSAAKVTVGRAARFVGQNAVQLHGGMGMTEELAIGHYFKRLTAIQFEYGTTDQHLARYAELS